MVTVSFGTFSKAFLPALAVFIVAANSAQVSVTQRASRKPISDSASTPAATLRVDVRLVVIPVQATNRLGASVRGLNREDFQLFEDGIEQKITHFSQEDSPISVGFLLDSSSGMKDKMRQAVEAGSEFLRMSNGEDEFFVVHFGERPKLAVPLTNDVERVRFGLLRARPLGRTSLLDAIEMSLTQMKDVNNTRRRLLSCPTAATITAGRPSRESRRQYVRPTCRFIPWGYSTGTSPQNGRRKSAMVLRF